MRSLEAGEVRRELLALRQQLADKAYFEKLDVESEDLAKYLRDGCRSMPSPEPLALFDNVYTEPNPRLDEQRAGFADYLAGFADSHTGGH